MIERIIEFCAERRGLVLLGVAFALAGAVWSIRNIELDAIPDLSDPQVIVFTEWMGRSPTLVEDQVTYPIVSSLLAAPKVTDVRGYSMFGMSFVHVLFEEGTDVYWARSRVLEYLSGIRSRLPEDVEPALGPDASGVGWVFQYVLVDKGGLHNLADLRTFQDFTLRYALGSVPGVAEVASVGGYEKQYQVTVDPEKLKAYGVSLNDVADAIRSSNNDVGGRVIEMSGREYYVRGRGYIDSLAAIETIAIRSTSETGTPVLIRNVGTVRFGGDIRRGLLEWNGEGEAVGGIVVMRDRENALQVIDRVKAKIAELKPAMPEGVAVEVAYDRSGLISRSVETLKRALIEEAIVVSLIIILFLLHLRSALLPILSLPAAVSLSFIPMVLLDIPSTIMSLGGIAIAIGATVDAEIVMIEASHKKLERAGPGADRHKLLAEAAREVTPAIFFSLLIIAVSFLPVFALNGQAGRMFKPLAYTKTFVMLFSAVLSITFAPALRDLFIRGRIRPEAQHPVSRFIIRLYKPFVYVALRRPKSTLAIGLFAILSAVPLATKLGHEFMPPLNEGDLLYMPITFPNISIEEAKRQLQMQDRVIKSFPEVESVFGKVGRAETPTDPAPLTMVETTIRLHPRERWPAVEQQRWYSAWAPEWLKTPLRWLWPESQPRTFDELVAALNHATQFPGWTNAFTMPIKTRIDMLTTGIRTPIGIKVFGSDLDAIERVGTALERELAPIRGTRSVLYERSLGGLYVDIVPKREALSRYGLTVGDVQRVIEAAIGGMPITTTVEGRNRFSVNVRYPQDVRSDLEQLNRLLVPASASMEPAAAMPMGGESPRTTATRFLPLGQLADIKIVGGPPMVRDEDGLLVGYVYVDVDLAERDIGGYVDEAKAVVSEAVRRGALTLPPGYFLKWTGQYELLEQMQARMKVVIPLTLMIVVLLLYLHFKHFIEVLVVLISIPFALVGSVWLLWLLDYRLSTAVWVGIIALVGLATQTGVVMIVYIDNAFHRRKQAGRIRDLNDIIWAHMEGTVLRVRPKLMTVSTMLLGLIPLLWASGSGADVMKRIAAPMVGGLITSAFLTLELIPVIYTYWRQEELLWERLDELEPKQRRTLVGNAALHGIGWALGVSLAVAHVYVTVPLWLATSVVVVAVAVAGFGAWNYLSSRPAARRLVWPSPAQT